MGEHRLCVSPTVSLFPSVFNHPGLSWCGTDFPALGKEGDAKLQSVIPLSSKASAAATIPGTKPGDYIGDGPGTGPRDLTIYMQFPYHLFFNILCSFWLPNFT